jgi:hypothetical protein
MLVLISLLISLLAAETRPKLTWKSCTKSGCTSNTGYIVVDDEWRSDGFEDIDYEKQIGVTTNGDALTQKFVTVYNGVKTVGSRLYLLSSDQTRYELFKLVGKEFTYDVDVSQLPCGMNSALYTIEMAAGGTGSGGAGVGSGYCDAQFLGDDSLGCAEFDIWEGNARANVYTSHSCSKTGQFSRSNGECSSNGCGFNPFRFGAETLYGNGSQFEIDSSKKLTVVTQFLSSGGSMNEVRRLYIQDKKIVPIPVLEIWGPNPYDSLSDGFCKTTGHDPSSYDSLKQMGLSFNNGHVLCFSLWDSSSMWWLDTGEYGPCVNDDTESNTYLEEHFPNISVTWSNIRVGDIDTTY